MEEHVGRRPRCVLGHVRERLLGDAVEAQTGGRGHRPDVAGEVEVHVEAGGGEVRDQVPDVGGGRHRRRRGVDVAGRQQADGAADVGEALAAEALGLEQRLLGVGRVALQRQPRAGEVEHRDGEGVGDRVVDLARDPLSLAGGGLVGELGLRRLQLAQQLLLPLVAGADHPAQGDAGGPDERALEASVQLPTHHHSRARERDERARQPRHVHAGVRGQEHEQERREVLSARTGDQPRDRADDRRHHYHPWHREAGALDQPRHDRHCREQRGRPMG